MVPARSPAGDGGLGQQLHLPHRGPSYTAQRNLIDTGWIAAYLGIALAAFTSGSDSTVAANTEQQRPSLASLVSPLVPVLVALTVAAVEIRLGHHLDHAAWLMAFGLIALVLARQGLIVLELLGPDRDAHEGMMERLAHAAVGGASTGEAPHSGYQRGGYEPR